MLGFGYIQSTGKHLRIYEHGRYRADQSAFRDELLGYGARLHLFAKFGKRANMPISALPLLAALTPAEHKITLIDENVEDIDFALCAKADIVGVTGMTVQRFRMTEILEELNGRGCFTVVGGPWVSVQE